MAKRRLNVGLRTEERILNKLSLNEGQTFLDIGAYVGSYSVWASKRVGRGGMVIAVEPHPGNFKMLLINTRKTNIIPVNVALWNKETMLNLHLSSYPSMHSLMYNYNYKEACIKVKALTLDSLIRILNVPRVDVVKIDVEGAELEVLEGAKQVLKYLKVILVEVHGKNQDIKEREKRARVITEILKSHGFSLERLDSQHILGFSNKLDR